MGNDHTTMWAARLMGIGSHPVPVIAGQLQRTAAQAEGEVLRADFSDAGSIWN